MAKLIEKLTAISGKMAGNPVLQIIQGGFMLMLPITMIGGFIALFNGISIEAYQAFLVSTGLKTIFNVIYQWTISMIGLYLSFLIAYQFAVVKQCAKSDIAVGLTSMICFLILTPYVIPEEAFAPSSLPLNWLGSAGMFSAIIVSFVVGNIFLFCKKRNIGIKLPEQVPPFIANQFTALIPVGICVILFGIINLIFQNTSFGCFHQLTYSIIAMPLQAVSTNVFGVWILMTVLYGLWFLGIHGGMTVGPIMMMLFMQVQMENLTAYQAGQALPHMVIGDALSYGTGSLPLLIAILIFAKSKSLRTMSKVAIVPAAFGVDEPAYFSIPMILNPMFFIPWVIFSPTFAVFGTHLLKMIGLLSYSNGTGGQNAANLPFFVGNMMNYGIGGLIWGCIFFAVIVAAYVPFVKAYDKQKLAEEGAEEESAE
jgi:PTS system cellobiose-specific IIC component